MTTMFTPDHEWINIEDHEAATVGITHHAQDALGDIVYVDLPKAGTAFAQNAIFGSVESVKAVSDVYSPVSGEVTAVNEALSQAPEKLNADPHGEAWLIKMKLTAPDELKSLLSAAQYQEYLEKGSV